MKVFYIECNAEELRTNRRFMDEIVDAVVGLSDCIFRPNDNVNVEEEREDTEEE